MKRQFKNDYSEVCHPLIFKAIQEICNEQNIGYGLDKYSLNAKKLILERFQINNGDVFFVGGGTQANLLVLSFLLKNYEGVICCDTGHINVHETAAIEGSGHKIITVNNNNGKLSSDLLKTTYYKYTDEHMVKPKAIYISDSTEIGTIYSNKELIELRKACDELGLLLFLDGARLGSALTSVKNDVSLKLLGEVCDAFYIGGTKNGFMFGEAIVFKDKTICNDFRYHIKNKGGMLSKGFVVAKQFERAFQDDLYFDIARHSNEMALYIKNNLSNTVSFYNDSFTNQLFIKMEKPKAIKVMNEFGCELWAENDNEIVFRVVTSFTSEIQDCDELINFIKELK